MDNSYTPTKELLDKYERLKDYLKSLGSVAVAYSSGVDSTFLLIAAKEALDDRVLAITASSCFVPKREQNEAVDFCKKMDIRHHVCQFDELSIEGIAQNPKNRCYICKRALFSEFVRVAEKEGLSAVAEGSNLDDNGDYRPGLQAVAELGIKSPLREVGFTKEEIRILSKYLNLPTWKKPSYACLASRFVYGQTITEEKLEMIDKAEQLLLDLGFNQMRVRIHDNMARIEVMPDEFEKLISNDVRNQITTSFKEFGFDYVAMDLIGFRSGSMNETLK